MKLYGAALLWLCGCYTTLLGSVSSCNFPTFMQTNGTQRDWSTQIKDQYRVFSQRITVEAGVMRNMPSSGRGKTVTRVCVQSMGNNKYLVAHEEAGQTDSKFACLQFVQRSLNVIQFRFTPESPTMDAIICSDDLLQLDDWLVVDRNHVKDDVRMCALHGGYTIRIFDEASRTGVCNAYGGATRLESECIKGDGLYFYFRKRDCVPQELYMYITQRTLCLANWQEGRFLFMLLANNAKNYMWVLRYPVSPDSSFVAHLFKDLIANLDEPVSRTSKYLSLSMVRDTARPRTSICVDSYEACSYSADPCSKPDLALSCPRTCGLCNVTRPSFCQFPPEWRGMWYNAAHSGTLALTVNATELTTHGDMDQKFYCIEWDPPAPHAGKDVSRDRMLVTEFSNGCRPQYTCARFLQKNPSVLFFKISSSKTWPLTKTPEEPVNCANFAFENDHALYPNLFRHKYFKLLYTPIVSPVKCNFPEGLDNYVATFRDGSECVASLQSGGSDSTVDLLISNCSTHPLDRSYLCLESSRILPTRDLVVVTRASRNAHELNCWLFPKRPRGIFYLLDPGHCNEGAKKRFRKGKVLPYAEFTKQRRKRVQSKNTRQGAVTAPSTTMYTTVENVYRTEVEVLIPQSTDNTTSTTDSEFIATPFVILAAVLFFAIFQIPCTCKS